MKWYSGVFANSNGDTWELTNLEVSRISSPKDFKDKIKAVYFNEIKRTTTVKFTDGDIITVKCSPDIEFDKHTGFVNAIAQKYIGSNSAIKRYINNANVIEKKENE
jgi:hypothetical protein